MQPTNPPPASPTPLIALGTGLTILFIWVSLLSVSFDSPDDVASRPLINVLLLLGASVLVYLVACSHVYQSTDTVAASKRRKWRSPLFVVVGFGILFRIVFLFSIPIQEIDLYRYILDGAIGNAGVEPYEFSPSEINAEINGLDRLTQNPVIARSVQERQTLTRLANDIAGRPGLRETVDRIHYGQYTTPYPPVSQLVFRIATAVVPEDASRITWLRWMKGVLIAFDIGTGLLIVALLKSVQLPPTYSVVYWWCPLVLKEIANSGHLDSIAVFLTTAFALLAVKHLWPASEVDIRPQHWKRSIALAIGAGVLLGLAVAAKIYPVVLAPVWAVVLFRRTGARVLLPLSVFVMVVLVSCWPMVRKLQVAKTFEIVADNTQVDRELVVATHQQLKVGAAPVAVIRRPETGIEVFSRYWEMNDLIFMVVVENVRPNQPTDGTQPWFLFTTETQRQFLVSELEAKIDLPPNEIPFWIARRLTLIVYSLIVSVLCWRAWRVEGPSGFLGLLFLSLAWFWLLSPTQNPWYWVWAMPFLVFIRRWMPWLLVSCVLLLYYLRFYFDHHFSDTPIAGTLYEGTQFFDFVIPWIEFAPILVWLIVGVFLFHGLKMRTTGRRNVE